MAVKEPEPVGPWERKAAEHHKLYPEDFVKLEAKAMQWYREGKRYFSVAELFHAIRRENPGKRKPGERFTVQQNYSPFYGKLLKAYHPELTDVIRSRGPRRLEAFTDEQANVTSVKDAPRVHLRKRGAEPRQPALRRERP